MAQARDDLLAVNTDVTMARTALLALDPAAATRFSWGCECAPTGCFRLREWRAGERARSLEPSDNCRVGFRPWTRGLLRLRACRPWLSVGGFWHPTRLCLALLAAAGAHVNGRDSALPHQRGALYRYPHVSAILCARVDWSVATTLVSGDIDSIDRMGAAIQLADFDLVACSRSATQVAGSLLNRQMQHAARCAASSPPQRPSAQPDGYAWRARRSCRCQADTWVSCLQSSPFPLRRAARSAATWVSAARTAATRPGVCRIQRPILHTGAETHLAGTIAAATRCSGVCCGYPCAPCALPRVTASHRRSSVQPPSQQLLHEGCCGAVPTASRFGVACSVSDPPHHQRSSQPRQ